MKCYMGIFACLFAVTVEGLAEQTTKVKPNRMPSDFLKLKWAEYYVVVKAHSKSICHSDTFRSDAQKPGKQFMKTSNFPLPVNDISMKDYIESLISVYQNVKQFETIMENYEDMFGNAIDLDKDGFISRDEHLEYMRCYGYTPDKINAAFDAMRGADNKLSVKSVVSVWIDFLTNPEPSKSAIVIAQNLIGSL